VQLAWVKDAEFMGYYIALDKGYYKAEGIDVELLPGGPEVIPEATLLSGRADIALTTPDTTINLIVKDDAPFKIVGAQYQKSPLGIVSLKESNIAKPEDLIGKTLAVPPVNTLSVAALLKKNGIDESKVNIVPYQYDPVPLIKKQCDATVDFVTNVPFTIQQLKKEPHWFLMWDHGFQIYNDTVVVTQNTLFHRREQLVRFLRASRKGWDENFKDTKKYPPLFEKTHFSGNGRTIENEVFFNTEQKELMLSDKGIFHMREEDIKANIDSLAAINIAAQRNMFVTELAEEI
jgi:ABC-type nitrate/sulfonate/bicarbonate transport system substrate-binding protein